MKIVLLTETYTSQMGYIQTMLPKYLARLGHEVHVVTMPLRPYYQLKDFKEIYNGFTSEEQLVPGSITHVYGYTVHVLAAVPQFGYLRMVDLERKLRELQPNIVQTWAAIGWIPMDAARLSRRLGFNLFTGNHNAMSMSRSTLGLDGAFQKRMKNLVTRYIPGRLASYRTKRCYAVTSDCAEIAWRYYGVERDKVEVMHLGVDTDFFYPRSSLEDLARRSAIRAKLQVSENEIICIYTGKLDAAKNALILAQAVQRLRGAGKLYTGLFIGNGPQRDVIATMPHCQVLDFMHFSDLGDYYRAAEIGVWPTNESTSQLDLAACGLPLVISDGVVYRDHVEGNGLVTRMGDVEDLVRQLVRLQHPALRQRLGERGASKMREHFSWASVAQRRVNHYEQSCHGA